GSTTPLSFTYNIDTGGGSGTVNDIITIKYYDTSGVLNTITRTGNQSDVAGANITDMAYGSNIYISSEGDGTGTTNEILFNGVQVTSGTSSDTIEFTSSALYSSFTLTI